MNGSTRFAVIEFVPVIVALGLLGLLAAFAALPSYAYATRGPRSADTTAADPFGDLGEERDALP